MIKVFALHDEAIAMEEKYRRFLEKGNHPLHHLSFYLQDTQEYISVTQMPKTFEWAEIIVGYLKDFINHQLHWTEQSNFFTKALDRVLPQYVQEYQDITQIRLSGEQSSAYSSRVAARFSAEQLEASRRFSSDLLLPLDELIDDWLQENILIDTEDRWYMWSIEPIGMDALIRRGQDFRIVDWERLNELFRVTYRDHVVECSHCRENPLSLCEMGMFLKRNIFDKHSDGDDFNPLDWKKV